VWCVVVVVCDVGLWRWCKGCVYGDAVRSEFVWKWREYMVRRRTRLG
jgi:hypothetical protein